MHLELLLLCRVPPCPLFSVVTRHRARFNVEPQSSSLGATLVVVAVHNVCCLFHSKLMLAKVKKSRKKSVPHDASGVIWARCRHRRLP